jgi:hypothetical protein
MFLRDQATLYLYLPWFASFLGCRRNIPEHVAFKGFGIKTLIGLHVDRGTNSPRCFPVESTTWQPMKQYRTSRLYGFVVGAPDRGACRRDLPAVPAYF